MDFIIVKLRKKGNIKWINVSLYMYMNFYIIF